MTFPATLKIIGLYWNSRFGDAVDLITTGSELSSVLNVQFQYLGFWYAAYTNPTWFQSEETSCSRAHYTLNDDGSIGVFNSGQDPRGR